MADEGTLATTAEVLLAIGENASADQILEANTNIWIKWAEGDIAIEMDKDVVTDYASVTTIGKRFLASLASNRTAFYAINQDQNVWSLATSQSKLNVIDSVWKSGLKIIRDKDKRAKLGLS